jgi:hypothetical protein
VQGRDPQLRLQLRLIATQCGLSSVTVLQQVRLTAITLAAVLLAAVSVQAQRVRGELHLEVRDSAKSITRVCACV